MLTIGELASIIDQNMINYEKRRDILNCICSNLTFGKENNSIQLLVSTLDTFKYFVIFMKDCLMDKV
jgi:hypothetical protein